MDNKSQSHNVSNIPGTSSEVNVENERRTHNVSNIPGNVDSEGGLRNVPNIQENGDGGQESRFHNVSDIPGRTDDLVVRNLREELERKEHEIEKLKLEKEVMRLKFENESLKTKGDNDSSGELKREVENLKLEVTTMKAHIQGLNPQNMPSPSQKQFFSISERLIEGVSRFIEGIEPNAKAYDSYTDWYEDITKIMRIGRVYVNPKYLLIRDVFTRPNISDITYVSHGKNRNTNRYRITFTSETLDEGWQKENIKMVLLLHPKDPKYNVELHFLRKDNKDWYGKEKQHMWISTNEEKNKACLKENVLENGKREFNCILCCIKF